MYLHNILKRKADPLTLWVVTFNWVMILQSGWKHIITNSSIRLSRFKPEHHHLLDVRPLATCLISMGIGSLTYRMRITNIVRPVHSVMRIKWVQLCKTLRTAHGIYCLTSCCYCNEMLILPPLLYSSSMTPNPILQKAYTHADSGLTLHIPCLHPFCLINL